MPKAFPAESRADVIAVARKGEAPLRQIAKDFGISEVCLPRWLKIADREHSIDDRKRPSRGVRCTDERITLASETDTGAIDSRGRIPMAACRKRLGRVQTSDETKGEGTTRPAERSAIP